MKLNQNVDQAQATRIVYYIDKYAKQHKLSKKLLFSIIAQESKFNTKAVSRTKDYGLTQMNIKTIHAYNFNKKLLMEDEAYAIECAAKLLADIKKIWYNEKNWWTRYNSSNPEKRMEYAAMVGRFM